MKVSPDIASLIPYKPGKPISETQREYGVSEVYKLASNENPLGPSPKAVEAIKAALLDLHRYPDPSCYELIRAIEKKWNIGHTKVAIGNGSNELIDLLIRIFCEPGESILTCDKGFVAYQVCAQAARVGRHFTPLNPDFTVNTSAIVDFLENNSARHSVRILFIPNPNNPTGTYIPQVKVEEILNAAQKLPNLLVVFDEAYNEFVRAKDYRSGQNYMAQYPNIAVIRTLSKAYGLAGLRVGVLLADPEVIDYVNRVRNPFNVNELAQVAAIAALGDEDFIRNSQETTWQGLDFVYQELKNLRLPYVESQANFVLFDTLRDVRLVNEFLLKKGVILRPVLNYGLSTHIRMSIGTHQENQIALNALKSALAEIKTL